MTNLLNLLAAIALLVWATHLVRTAMLDVFGAHMRALLHRTTRNRLTAALTGIGVTALVQSSTATSLMISGFVGQNLVSLPAALAVMRGADIGTALISVLFSVDLSWLSPLFIFAGVVLYSVCSSNVGAGAGKGLIGLGLMLLALHLVVAAAGPLLEGAAMRTLITSISGDVFVEIAVGAVLAVVTYSSLGVVLLVAAMSASQVLPLDVALGLVLGANLGSGLLAVLTTWKSSISVRRVTVGNLIFKLLGVLVAAPLVLPTLSLARGYLHEAGSTVVIYHLVFNVTTSLALIAMTERVAHVVLRLLPDRARSSDASRPSHLDPSALATPALAISNSTREALYQADLVETMLTGALTVIQNDDLRLAQELRKLETSVDELYSGIKKYLTHISREDLSEEEGRRWAAIIRFTITIEQIADIVEQIILDIEEKKIRVGKQFSDAGMAEIVELHQHLVANLRLAMSVFLHGGERDARRLLQEKHRFQNLVRACSNAHLMRLLQRTPESVATSSLHIDLITDLKQINSHICDMGAAILGPAPIENTARA